MFWVKWKGYPEEHNEWVSQEQMENASKLVQDFYQRNPQAPRNNEVAVTASPPHYAKSVTILSRKGMDSPPNTPFKTPPSDNKARVDAKGDGGQDDCKNQDRGKHVGWTASDVVLAAPDTLIQELVSAHNPTRVIPFNAHIAHLKRLWIRSQNDAHVSYLAEVHPSARLPTGHVPIIRFHRLLHPFMYKLDDLTWDIPTSDIAVPTRLMWTNMDPPSIPCLKVKRLNASARLQTQGSAEAAGYDLYASAPATIPPLSRALVPLGIAPPDATVVPGTSPQSHTAAMSSYSDPCWYVKSAPSAR